MPRARKALAEYRRKRDFSKTGEPAGGAAPARRGRLRFVIQKHAATRLHFDLRLELDGVMKSWAVPKGPSLDPSERRLAMQVEDHPIEYNTFEGVIPQGEYGGGTVMLWDRGTYAPNYDDRDNDIEALHDGLRRGRLKVRFDGKRMRGAWTLVRMHGRDENPDKPAWLFIKERDEHADPSHDLVAAAMTSIASRRTMDQIASGRSRRWTRASGAKPAPPRKTSGARKSASKREATRGGSKRVTTKRANTKRTTTKRTTTRRTTTSRATTKRPKTKRPKTKRAKTKRATTRRRS